MTQLVAAVARTPGVNTVAITGDFLEIEIYVAEIDVSRIEAAARAVGFDILWI